ncbi:mevalonate kinase family protein [Wenzhouxiangella marina]|uniref:GHMP kinase N-terminal domain-containing protein n=1 Tax=Wenzhouxiangella marina TaxID=1579979 RepID=A0A0K0XX47_9GAMM|nr:hypothetical protein [Wenzhouxiangella marina]AKS42269.1 hypothetical protein WM2015_1903 [Wenzhouxiangella marina]MBB6085958.1 phosphomevalonate kinase [Wenzhouxiangella marina]
MSMLAQAPGKAVLIGEYAVTDGGAALSLAVDRHARVRLSACGHGGCRISAPELGLSSVAFTIDPDSGVLWDRRAAGFERLQRTAGLISHRVLELQQAGFELEPFRLDIDTRALYLSHDARLIKLGLGSSSAVAVAVDAAIGGHAGQAAEDADQALARLLPPYRHGQGGEGSGIDLATSLYGGLIEFRPTASGAEVRPLDLPANLELRFAWTGAPASTPALLARYRAWSRETPRKARQWQLAAAQIVADARAAIQAGDAASLVACLGEYGDRMGTMGDWMGVNLLDGQHAAIMEQAERLGLAAKPSGAGVGDLALIAGTEPDRMLDMSRWLAQRGIPELVMQVDRNGVRLERSESGGDSGR